MDFKEEYAYLVTHLRNDHAGVKQAKRIKVVTVALPSANTRVCIHAFSSADHPSIVIGRAKHTFTVHVHW